MPPFCGVNWEDSKIVHLSFAFLWFDPPDTSRNPTELSHQFQFGISSFPTGEGSFLVLETTSLNHGNIPTRFVRVFGKRYIDIDLSIKSFRAILFHVDAKF